MKDFHPEYLYKDIAYCLHSECPLSQQCLRQLSYQTAPPFYEAAFIDPRKETGEACPRYLSNEVVAMARGFKHALYQLRYGEVADFQSRLSDELGCRRSQYYRYCSGETRLTPEQQATVREVLAEFGIEGGKELFDAYEPGYCLD